MVSNEDKDEVRALMNALVYFGQIEQSTALHNLLAQLLRAEHVCATKLFSVEQQSVLD